jgi:hypothetical protein
MAFVQGDRTRERTATTGTGALLSLLGTLAPNQRTFDVGVGLNNQCFYELVSGDGVGWEIGIGHVPATAQLNRDVVVSNHLGTTARISLVGESRVFTTLPGNLGFAFTKIFGGTYGQDFLRWNINNNAWEATVGNATWHQAAALASTGPLPACTYNNGPTSNGVGATLTGNANGLLTVDGVSAAVGLRILVKDQANPVHNGIYVATAAGDSTHPFILTRAVDYDDSTDIAEGDCVSVGGAGSVNGKTVWTMDTGGGAIAIGTTTDINWTLIASRASTAPAGGVSWHTAAALATAAALPANTYSNGSSGVGATLTGTANGALSVDGVAVLTGYRILVKDEASAAHNGIYVATQAGDSTHPYILTRSTDYDDASNIAQADVTVVGVAGATNGHTIWVSTIPDPFTLGTSTISWSLVISLPTVTANGDVLTVQGTGVAWLPPASSGVSSANFDTVVGSTRGDIPVRGATTWGALAPGTNGYVLKMGATDPAWGQLATTNLTDVAYTSLADRDVLVYSSSSTKVENRRAHYGVSFSAPQTTAYTASQVVGHHAFTVGVTIPANFGSYNGRTSKAGGTANATGSTVVSVEKAASGSPNTFSQIGTITIAASGVAATFATASGAAQTFSAGDVLRLVMPATPDATFAGFYCSIVGRET